MPRRPGGKYRGLIVRTKGEDTLQAEAEERARRARELAVKRAAELKARQLTSGHALAISKEEAEEAKKQKILNVFVGGKKNVKKYFQNWIVGIRQVKKEKALQEREASWRKSCDCPPGFHDLHNCNASRKLMNAEYDMPFDYYRKRAQELRSLVDTHTSVVRASRIWASKACVGSSNVFNRSRSVGALPPVDNTTTLAKTMSATQLFQNARQEEPWVAVDGKNVQTVFHHSSGRPVFLDKQSMRFVFTPKENQDWLARKRHQKWLREEAARQAELALLAVPEEVFPETVV